MLLLVFIGIDILFVEQKGGFVRNLFAVLSGRKSWVGLSVMASDPESSLVPGVLYPSDAYPNNTFSEEMTRRLEEIYVRNYSVRSDMEILLRGFYVAGR